MTADNEDPIEDAYSLIDGGKPEEAARRLRARLDSGRGGLQLRLTLSEALLAADRREEALEVARETAQLNPGVAVAAFCVGRALAAMDMLPVAIAEFQRALRLDPAMDEARLALGQAWIAAGEADKALEELAQIDETDEETQAAIAYAEAMKTQTRSDAGYVRHLFDQFSSDYDHRMRDFLSYQAPEILRGLADMILPGARNLRIMDLGCGTGLTAGAFRDMATYIDGLDLSPRMIEKAKATGLYRNLAVADIEKWLNESRSPSDLVVAADTLVYLGDLEPVFKGVARQLEPGKHFLFTVESGEEGFAPGYSLGPKRRWRHSGTYIRDLAERSGFEVDGMVECAPRSEAGAPVPGLAVALRRR